MRSWQFNNDSRENFVMECFWNWINRAIQCIDFRAFAGYVDWLIDGMFPSYLFWIINWIMRWKNLIDKILVIIIIKRLSSSNWCLWNIIAEFMYTDWQHSKLLLWQFSWTKKKYSLSIAVGNHNLSSIIIKLVMCLLWNLLSLNA